MNDYEEDELLKGFHDAGIFLPEERESMARQAETLVQSGPYSQNAIQAQMNQQRPSNLGVGNIFGGLGSGLFGVFGGR